MCDSVFEVCPGCKVTLPAHASSVHAYIGASPACWALYGKVLAREYASVKLMTVHRLTVDAYAAQHPGKPGRRATQSVWVHLAGLYLTTERGFSNDFARRVIGALAALREPLEWLEPPAELGTITVIDAHHAADPDTHCAVVHRWAESVWEAWRPHRQAVIRISDLVAARL